MTNMQFDSEVSRKLESAYTTPDMAEQRRVVRTALALRRGDRVLDVGVGPGLLAAEMAEEVGPEGRLCGIDISESMLALAAGRAAVPNGPTIELELASADSIPYDDNSFDVVVSTQVFEYLDDVPAALDEARRVLRPRGRVVLLDTDWGSLVWRSADDGRMRRVLTAFDEHNSDPHLPRRLGELLEEAGFSVTQLTVAPLLNVGFDPASYSAGLIDIIAGFVPGRAGVSEAEAQAWAEELRSLGPGYFFSLNRYLFVASALWSRAESSDP